MVANRTHKFLKSFILVAEDSRSQLKKLNGEKKKNIYIYDSFLLAVYFLAPSKKPR